jgi:cellulose 1,4-beta-cellobiosidase
LEVAQLPGNTYHLQANEYSSSAAFEAASDGCSDFDIATSGISQAQPYGEPGGYPSLYKGCHWGDCTSASGLPVEVSVLTPGVVTTADDTTTVSSGAWDDAYDIWFNSIATGTQGTTTGLEMMVWLDHYGGIQPAGGIVATDVVVGGNTYDVWYSGPGSNGGTVSYVLVSPVSSLSFDLAPLAADAVARGYMPRAWYLIDVEAGFELWQGGQGLGIQSFSVNVAR